MTRVIMIRERAETVQEFRNITDAARSVNRSVKFIKHLINTGKIVNGLAFDYALDNICYEGGRFEIGGKGK